MRTKTEWTFDVVHHGESAAGITPYSETVKILVDGDPGGDAGEFQEYMREALKEWFDGAKVYTRAEMIAICEAEDREFAAMQEEAD